MRAKFCLEAFIVFSDMITDISERRRVSDTHLVELGLSVLGRDADIEVL